MGLAINEWIKQTRKNAKMTQERLGTLLGYTKANISLWESGRHKPSLAQLLAISHALNVPLPIDVKHLPRSPEDPNLRDIFQFDAKDRLGHDLILNGQSGVIDHISVSTEWIQKTIRGVSSPKNLCLVTGFGDSMRPMFNPGDPLIVDTAITTVECDAVYFFCIENEGFVKSLQRVPGEGIRVISANPAYETWTITEEMDFKVLGRVLKVWKGENF